MSELQSEDGVRLDIWLWRARFIKTRSQAAKLIKGGKVRLTRLGETRRVSKAHTTILPGDEISFMRGEQLIHVKMLSPGTRRGPAPEAQSLYDVIQSIAHSHA